MNRRNQILAAILALQLVAVAIVIWPRPATSDGDGEALLPGLETDRIVALTVTGGEDESIQLAKSSGEWVLPEADDYPALADKVTPLLTKIVGLKTDRLVTETSSSHKRLKVADDEFERRIEIELADGTRHRLYVGTSPTIGVAHVRAAGADEVYLTSDLSAQDAGFEASAYVDRVYFSVPREEVTSITLENANGRFELQRTVSESEGVTADQWSLAGLGPDETLSQANVKVLFNRAVSVAMLRPLGTEDKTEYGLQNPTAVLTVKTRGDGERDRIYTLYVGAKEESGNTYVVTSSGSPYYVRVSEFTVKEFVEKTRDDLLELPPTPTPAPEGSPEATPESP